MKILDEIFLVVLGFEPDAADSESAMLGSQPRSNKSTLKKMNFKKMIDYEFLMTI